MSPVLETRVVREHGILSIAS